MLVIRNTYTLLRRYGARAYRVFQQFLEPELYILAPLRSDQQENGFQARARPEQFLDERFAHEPGAAGDEHRSPVVEIYDAADVRGVRHVPVLASEIVVVVGHVAAVNRVSAIGGICCWAVRVLVHCARVRCRRDCDRTRPSWLRTVCCN